MSITDKLSLVENSYNEIVEKLNDGNIKDNRAIQELMKMLICSEANVK